jgi:hypothetical protein
MGERFLKKAKQKLWSELFRGTILLKKLFAYLTSTATTPSALLTQLVRQFC